MLEAVADNLVTNAPNERARANLLESTTKESGAWLNAIPLSYRGLRMDNKPICVAIGLKLDAPLCHPHQCQHCGSEGDKLATSVVLGARVIFLGTQPLMALFADLFSLLECLPVCSLVGYAD